MDIICKDLIWNLVFLYAVASENCDVTWTDQHHRSHCYNVMVEPKLYAEHASLCYDTYGGGVVTITSVEEQEFINNLMSTNGLNSIWIGLREVKSSWKWRNGPDILLQGCFLDDQMNTHFYERNIVVNNSHAVCRDKCDSRGFAFAALQNGEFCWCGDDVRFESGYSDECKVTCPGHLTQLCGGTSSRTVLSVHGSFSNWLQGQPNNHLGYQACAEMDPYTEPPGKWLDISCSERRYPLCLADQSICELLQADNSSSDTVQVSDMFNENGEEDSFCFVLITQYATQFEARKNCHDVGGKLASILTESANTKAAEFMIAVNLTLDGLGVWIDLGRSWWQWDSGEELFYSTWVSQKPNSESQKCVLHSTSLGSSTWDDIQCTGVFPTICETDSSVNYAPTSLPPSTSTTESSTETMPMSISTTVSEEPVESNRKLIITDEYKAIIVGSAVVLVVIVIAVLACYAIAHRKKNIKKKKVPTATLR